MKFICTLLFRIKEILNQFKIMQPLSIYKNNSFNKNYCKKNLRKTFKKLMMTFGSKINVSLSHFFCCIDMTEKKE